jgi:hypothetical protein
VVREGDAEAGGYGAYAQFLTLLFNDDGLVSFEAKVDTPAPVNSKPKGAYFEAVHVAATSRTGDKTPVSPSGNGGIASIWRGALAGTDGTTRVNTPVFNNNGHLALRLDASDGGDSTTTRNDTRIRIVELQNGEVISNDAAREGGPAPGLPGAFMGPITGNPSLTQLTAGSLDSVISFPAKLTGEGVNAQNNAAVFSGEVGVLSPLASRSEKKGSKVGAGYNPRSQSSTVAPVVRKGDIAPGTGGAQFSGFKKVRNASTDQGSLAFVGNLKAGSGLPADAGNLGIWTHSSGTGSLVARSGARATGSSGNPVAAETNFKSFPKSPLLSRSGAVAFAATLSGEAVNAANNFGIWSSSLGWLRKVAQEGDAAAGTSNGETIKAVKDFAANHFGDVVFTVLLTGEAARNQAIYLWDAASGQTHLLLRKGDVLNIDEGATDELGQGVLTARTVKKTNLLKGASSGGSDGHASAFNGSGEVAVVVRLSGGRQGVFVLNPNTP